MRSLPYKKSTATAIGVFIFHTVTPFLIATSYYLASSNWYGLWVAYPLIGLFLGTRFRAINNMSHETYHNSFCLNKNTNRFFGQLLAIIELSDFDRTRLEHYTHHKYLGILPLDQDLRNLASLGINSFPTRKNVYENLRNAFLLRHLTQTFSVCLIDKNAPIWAKVLRRLYILALIYLAFTTPIFFILFILIPYVYFYQAHKFIMDLIDHAGLLKNLAPIQKTRNFIIKNQILSWLLLPRNDGYHLVHHLYPSLSIEVLGQAHEMLNSREDYRTLSHSAKCHIAEWLNHDTA